MKLTNYDILMVQSIISKNGNSNFPQKIMYALFKNEKILKEHTELYQQMLMKILDNYKDFVIFDEEGNAEMFEMGVPKVKEEVREQYLKDIEELLKIEVDVDIYKIDSEIFDYNEERYDSLPLDLMKLLSKD